MHLDIENSLFTADDNLYKQGQNRIELEIAIKTVNMNFRHDKSLK